MYRPKTVTAAATAIAAHAAALGADPAGTPEEGLKGLLDSLDRLADDAGLDLDGALLRSHVARGKSLYLVTLRFDPTPHAATSAPAERDVEITAPNLAHACKLALEGLRTNPDVRLREGTVHAPVERTPPDPDRYAAMAAIRPGHWEDIADALTADRVAKRAAAAPSPWTFHVPAHACDAVEAATHALSVHDGLLGATGDDAVSSEAIDRLARSLFDYAEATGVDLHVAMQVMRSERAAPSPVA